MNYFKDVIFKTYQWMNEYSITMDSKALFLEHL